MVQLAVIHLALLAILVVAAIIVHVKAQALVLPLAPARTVPALVLVLVAAANAAYQQLSRARGRLRPGAPGRRRLLDGSTARRAAQVVQALATAALVALLVESAAPGRLLECGLEARWQQLWQQHDAAAVQAIQDALACCGFRSVKDRAWPFPVDGGTASCASRHGRQTACAGPWRASMQGLAGLDLAIVLAAGLLQFLAFVLVKYGVLRLDFESRFFTARDTAVTRPLLHDAPPSTPAIRDIDDEAASEGPSETLGSTSAEPTHQDRTGNIWSED